MGAPTCITDFLSPVAFFAMCQDVRDHSEYDSENDETEESEDGTHES